MSKTELLSLDPQHRLVMENVYHALENAGVTMENAISSNTSVFVNGYNHDHADNINLDLETTLKYKPTGTDNSLISGRVSWFYDFRGPSLTIDTACSGSLVGLHLACQSLKEKESDMAVVSGVNVIGFLSHMIGMSYSGFVGSEGKCFSFDHRADGYARGEGVGTVIVKRLSDAVEDGNIIRALIRGTGLNHDGRTPGITYPSLSSQEELIRRTYRRAGLDTADTCYIESHGTGTQAGDFIEASAISRGFDTASRNTPLYVGALKSNIGHLEGGSGIAGLIKTIMILENGIIPPNVNFEKPNPKIPVDEWKLKFPTERTPWPHSGPRRASVSCFGLNGTNSHCILDDACGFLTVHGVVGKHRTVPPNTSQPQSSNMNGNIPAQDDAPLSPKQPVPDAHSGKYLNGNINTAKAPSKLFLVSAFDEKAFSRMASQLADYLGNELTCDKGNARVNEPAIAHPSSTAIQIALVDLLESWGITPSRVVGHSSGEIAAAYCAGKISREAAWKVAYFRGQVVDLKPYLEEVRNTNPEGVLTIACFNGPKNQTVSGDTPMIDELKRRLDAHRIFARKLKLGKAYHSPHMKTFTEDYQHAMGSLQDLGEAFDDRSVEMFSTFTGEKVLDWFLDSSYWCANMVGSVQFEKALRSFCDVTTGDVDSEEMGSAIDEIVEIGAHGALRSAIKETIDTLDGITYWPTLDRNTPDATSLLQTVAGLSSRGYPVNISEINQAQSQFDRWDLLSDLPPYPFDHSYRDIYESRLAKNLRLREHPRHDIFGAPKNDWDPRYPSFRHFLRLRESPWLKEYMVYGRYVYPPAGFLVMAVESSMQMAGRETSIRGIHVSRVGFKALLPIPDHAEGVEVSLSYAPADDRSGMSRFHVSSYNEAEEQWNEHCSGYISVEYAECEGGLEIDGETNTEWLDSLRDSEKQLTESVERRKVFEQLESSGLHLGPLFQHLSNMKTSGNRNGHGLASVEVPDIRSIMPEHYMLPHMLHPVTLQNMLSSVTVALSDLSDTQPEGGVFFPKYIDNVWISSGGSYKPHTQFRCFSTVTAAGIDLRHCQIHILAEPSLSEVAVSFSGIQLARHISDEDFSKTPTIPRFYSTEWKPDIHLVANQFFDSLVNHQEDTDNKYGSECELFTDLQLAATLLSTDALFDLKGLDLTGLEPHYHRFYDLLKHVAADILTNAIPRVPFKLWKKYAQDEHLKADLYKRVQSRNSDGALLIRVGTRIPAFFRQELDPLHIMFGQDDLMTEYYDDDFKIGTIQEKLSHYLSLFRWNKSNLSILEVGAGTGSFTSQILTHLSPQDAERSISEYVFTDLSPGFFEKAKQRLRPWSDIVTYKKLDVGNDPLAQGFELAAFDLIIASNVLHATPNLHDTLRNIHSLLKPGGKLVFHEGVRQDALWTNISFSPLSGWWLSTEPERRWCPYIPTEIWNDYLHTAGFSGIDLEFASSDYAEFSKISLMVSTALGQSSRPVPDRVEAVLLLPDSKDPAIVKELRRQMEQLGISLSIHTLSEASTLDISEKPCLALLETDMPILSPDTFTAVDELKELLVRCRNMIWVSKYSTKDPSFDIATGLIRSMRHAGGKDDRNLVTVSVSDTGPIDNSLAETISKIFRHQFLSPALCETKNAEYRIEKGSILTSRVSPNQDATLTIRSGLSLPQAVPTPWNDVYRPLKLFNRQSRGSDQELVWVSDNVQSETLGDDEVDIDIKAVSLRWRDSLASNGELPQEGLGGEASGIITRVGSAVTGLHKGDRVMCFSDRRQGRKGALRSVLRVSPLLVTLIPDDLSFEAAATLLADWAVAIYSLKYIGKLDSTDKILIQAAPGSIGQAAIRYAQSIGAEIFAGVSNAEEKEYLMREYGLFEDHIFHTRSPFMSNQIKQKVPNGVDIVLMPSSDHGFMRSIDYVAPFGKIIEVSTGNVQSGVSLPSINHPSGVIFARVDVHSFAKHRPSMVQEVFGDIRHLLSLSRTFPEQPAKVLTYSQLHEGLQMLRGGNIDNVILQPADDIVPVVPEVSRPSMLDGTASYIIIGDLSPLSLKMGMRLAERGAKNLTFLSTSPSLQADDGETERLLGSLGMQGCAVHLRSCNFFDESELHHAVTELKQQLPPIKGVIYRPHETEPIKSTESASNHYQEVRELWLVHRMFPAVDYLVMLSPMKGLDGLCTESETHPTRTFQDAIVHHRVSLGQHSASVDLGDMTDDDALAVIDYATSSRDHASFPSSQIISQFPSPFSSDGQQSVPTYLSDPLFHQLPVSQPRDKSTDAPTERKLSVADLLQSSNDSKHAGEIVSREIRRKLSNLLNVSEDEISPEHNIRDNGVDSLIEMEFQNWIDKELKISLPSEDLITKSISRLSAQVVSASPLVQCT
ncbi:polyketide synthase [Aspergillus terreus]|uniref:Polyketide synthase n=1 Tax=Aspergillus terreus TaxID=33178 RepID=A0A5M3Z7L9_ASPTE|nr:hypothetical protein ATETN484_0008050000 [Aspergillus terreus]GFF21328.1 polyketide synthase [Aspergillus terreus]